MKTEAFGKRPTVSVVIPHFNHGRYVGDCVKAILSQSAPPDEVIIIDDASTDGSVETLKELARDSRVRLVLRARNMGVFETLREGFGLARHDYVFAPAADDMTLPGFLEKSLDLLARHPAAGFSTAMAGFISEDGRYLGPYRTPVVRPQPGFLSASEFQKTFFRYGSWVVSYSVIYRRDAAMEVMRGIKELGPTLDGFLIHSLGCLHGACVIPEELVLWRRLETGFANTYGRDVQASATIIERLCSSIRGVLPPSALPEEYLAKLRRLSYEEILNNLSHQGVFDGKSARVAVERLNGAGMRLRLYKAAMSAGAGRWATKIYLFLALPPGEQLRIILRKWRKT